MSKRFTDSTKWDRRWIRQLSCEHKLFWLYLLDKCNHAGVWDVDMDLASFQLGIRLDEEDVLAAFGDRIVPIVDDKWFIPKFVEFQYGPLNPENRAHASVIGILEYHNLAPYKGLISPLKGRKDKDKDKDKDKERGGVGGKGEYPPDFKAFWSAYPKKKGKDDAFRAWKQVSAHRPPIKDILLAIKTQKRTDDWKRNGGQFVPHPGTWLRAGRWADEVEVKTSTTDYAAELERRRQAQARYEAEQQAKAVPMPPDVKEALDRLKRSLQP